MKTRRTIRVHLTTGRTIEGVLITTRRKYYELADARIEIDGTFHKFNDRVYIPHNKIEFVQGGAS